MATVAIVRTGTLDAIVETGTLTAIRTTEVVIEPVLTPKPATSHTTLGAGIDLRKLKRERQVQILKLTVEVPMRGTKSLTQNVTVPMKASAKKTQNITIPMKGNKKITQNVTTIPMKGTAFSRQYTAVPMMAEKSRILQNLNEEVKRLKMINTLKEALRELDDNNA